MKPTKLSNIARAVSVGAIVFGSAGIAHGGWTGYLLGTGSGWAYVSVTPPPAKDGAALPGKALKGSSTNSPGAWLANITPTQDPSNTNSYTTNAFLPKDSGSASTIARAVGFPGVIWQAYTAGYNGDKTDALELQEKVKIKTANCPTLSMDSALIGFDGVAGSIAVNTVGTPGTALWIRGFEITADMVVPEDNIDTPENETTIFLNEHADLRFENLMIGPFEYGVNGKCELVIHFTLKGGTINNLAFVTDGVALSDPIVVACPGPQTVACGQPYAYPSLPSAGTGGCGTLTYSYSPAVEDLVVGLNTVTVTATDEKGDKGTCEFIVEVTDDQPPVPAGALPTVTGQCSATITAAPTAIDACSGPILGTTTDALSYNTQGTHTVTWNFDDGHGNILTKTQDVVVQDTVAPLAPVLPVVTATSCGSPVTGLPIPYATDNCAGSVPGSTTTMFPITAMGTNLVVWTFNDGHGNSSTSTQKVVLSGLTLVGFYAPLNASGGLCTDTAKNVKAGSVIPIKFDVKCGSTLVTTGPAPVVKVESWADCKPSNALLSVNAEYQNDWHANWDTTGWKSGVYKIIVELPDGSKPYVFVNLK